MPQMLSDSWRFVDFYIRNLVPDETTFDISSYDLSALSLRIRTDGRSTASGVVAGETGIALQNRGASVSLAPDHPNRLEPGKRPFHTLIPAVTKLARRGHDVAVLPPGRFGGARIVHNDAGTLSGATEPPGRTAASSGTDTDSSHCVPVIAADGGRDHRDETRWISMTTAIATLRPAVYTGPPPTPAVTTDPMTDPTPEGPTPLTPAALESLLADASHEAFVAFLADLRERCGWAVDREGSVLTVTRDGDRERLLVWTDDRGRLERLLGAGPAVPDAGPVDAVVTRSRDATSAAVVAEDRGAAVIDTAGIHDRLLYAIDRESARALCEAHFDRPVAPRPGRDAGTDADPGGADGASTGAVSSRALLVGVALLALVVAGAAGLPAGPLGAAPDVAPGGDTVETPAATPFGADGTGDASASTPTPASTPANGGNAPGTPTPANDSDAPGTPTPANGSDGPEASGPRDCPGCPSLLAFDDAPTATADATTTINGTLSNPYPFPLSDVAVDLEAPGGNWIVSPVEGTTVDTLGPKESRPVAWTISAPPGTEGNHTLAATTVYADGRSTLRTTAEYDLAVAAPGLQPPAVQPCTETLGPLVTGGSCHLLTLDGDPPGVTAGETTTITGRLYNPREYALANGSVALEAPGNWTVTPLDGTTFDELAPGAVRVARWNVTPPASASGTVGLSGVTNYTRRGGPGNPNVSLSRRYPVAVSDAAPSACVECASLLSLDPVAARAGSTTTVTGTVENPSDVGVSNAEIELVPPGENWTVAPINGTAFQTLPEGTSRPAAWNLTPPPDAEGAYTVRAISRYDTGTDALRVVTEHEVIVAGSDIPPFEPCSDCASLLALDSDTVRAGSTTTVTGTVENPYLFTLSIAAVRLESPGPGWTVTPLDRTAFRTLPTREPRPVAWNVTPPPDAEGAYALRTISVYAIETDAVRVAGEYDVTVDANRTASSEAVETGHASAIAPRHRRASSVS